MRYMVSWVFDGLLATVVMVAGLELGEVRGAERPPNYVILFADDLGYGDLGCYGHPTIRTPNLDRMAAGGMRFTQFYAAASLCTPSRAALLTGRLPIRKPLADLRNVLFPRNNVGLPGSEITIAEALKTKDYATACIGKWHLGHLPQFLPTRHGFDYYYGIPYSNDMKPTPLMRNEEVIEEPAVQATLTPRYTQESIAFIKKNRDKPFFLYVPYTFPHSPLAASDRFRGKSRRGLYGDAVEEIDWSVGEILGALSQAGVAEKTLAVFTSDNGPWTARTAAGGSAGLLRDGKSTTWEGGMREPGIFYWPGRIKAGAVSLELAGTLDLFPTLLTLSGVALPADRRLDGHDLSPVLLGTGAGATHTVFYYRAAELMAVRKDAWKLHLQQRDMSTRRQIRRLDPPLLYHLEHDPSEQYDVAAQHPDVVADLKREADVHTRFVSEESP